MSVCIYILELESGKYYVGKTSNLEKRLTNHFNQNGAAWTKKHKPVRLLEHLNNCDDEDKYVIEMMHKHGVDNVRGGTFSRIYLSSEERKMIKKLICSRYDLCFKCGRPGHFVTECPNEVCARCGRSNHNTENCYAKRHIDGHIINSQPSLRAGNRKNLIKRASASKEIEDIDDRHDGEITISSIPKPSGRASNGENNIAPGNTKNIDEIQLVEARPAKGFKKRRKSSRTKKRRHDRPRNSSRKSNTGVESRPESPSNDVGIIIPDFMRGSSGQRGNSAKQSSETHNSNLGPSKPRPRLNYPDAFDFDGLTSLEYGGVLHQGESSPKGGQKIDSPRRRCRSESCSIL